MKGDLFEAGDCYVLPHYAAVPKPLLALSRHITLLCPVWYRPALNP